MSYSVGINKIDGRIGTMGERVDYVGDLLREFRNAMAVYGRAVFVETDRYPYLRVGTEAELVSDRQGDDAADKTS